MLVFFLNFLLAHVEMASLCVATTHVTECVTLMPDPSSSCLMESGRPFLQGTVRFYWLRLVENGMFIYHSLFRVFNQGKSSVNSYNIRKR